MFEDQVDQMVIHSASDPRPKTTFCGDYFYNYFTRGLDILFDGQVFTLFMTIVNMLCMESRILTRFHLFADS